MLAQPMIVNPSKSEIPGSPQAPEFRSVYAAELGYVWNTLRRLGVRWADLEDLTHDVFVIVFRRLADFDPSRPIRPWLFGIAFRVASDHRRSARATREVEGLDQEIPSELPSPEDQVAAADARRLVRAGLESLDLDRRAVFIMHELDGHSMPEIASSLSVPLNTLYSRLRLAREQWAAAVRRIRLRGGEA